MEMRNLATIALADELGFDVVPRTKIGLHTVPSDPTKPLSPPKTTLGLVMEKAPGTDGRSTPSDLYKDPDVRRELTKLQLLDALTGQGDRHCGNDFIHKDPSTGKVTVRGIDNDQCFGKNLSDPNGILQGPKDDPDTKGFRGVKLPQVVDQDMVQAFKRLTPERLEELLTDKLSPDEINAAKARLGIIKKHLSDLQTQSSLMSLSGVGDDPVLGPDDWGCSDVMKLSDWSTSYVVRDFTYRRGKEQEAQQQLAQQQMIQKLVMKFPPPPPPVVDPLAGGSLPSLPDSD